MRCLSALLIVCCAFAQKPAEQEEVPLFRTGVSLVKVDVEVKDKAGIGVNGLRGSDFVLYDEGQRQTLGDFEADAEPVRVLMLLDVSPSMSKWLADLGSKSTESLRALRAGDEVGLMTFATRSGLVQPLTTDTKTIGKQVIGNIYKQMLGSETLVNEALLAAAKYMGEQPAKGRRAILIVTDNEGATRTVQNDEVIRALHASDIVLSAILVGDGANRALYSRTRYAGPASAATPDVARYAAETGGQAISGAAPANALQPILKGLTTRYSFQYTAPSAEDGTFRRIRVELAPHVASRYPGAQIKARSGYTVGASN